VESPTSSTEAQEADWAVWLLHFLEEAALDKVDKVDSTAHLENRVEVWEACSVESSAVTSPLMAAGPTHMATLTIRQAAARIKDKHHLRHTSQLVRAATSLRAVVTTLQVSSTNSNSMEEAKEPRRAMDTTSRSMGSSNIMDSSLTLAPPRITTVDHPVSNRHHTTSTAVVRVMANKAILRHLRANMAVATVSLGMNSRVAMEAKAVTEGSNRMPHMIKVDIKHTEGRATMVANKATMEASKEAMDSPRILNGGSRGSERPEIGSIHVHVAEKCRGMTRYSSRGKCGTIVDVMDDSFSTPAASSHVHVWDMLS
jgi:hypothetical protein